MICGSGLEGKVARGRNRSRYRNGGRDGGSREWGRPAKSTGLRSRLLFL